MKPLSCFSCVRCGARSAVEDNRYFCACGGLLDVIHDFIAVKARGADSLKRLFARRRAHPLSAADESGVWRYRELVWPGLGEGEFVTMGEGNTRLYAFGKTAEWAGASNARFKHEGENPTGSFKDRGMTVAMSRAKQGAAKIVACASTGNTSASVAAYASRARLPAMILISEQATAVGKISQALAYGALTVRIRGDFDTALGLALDSRDELGLTILNSVNPFRIEGQKTIIWEALEQMNWRPPDWIVVPGGNLGNTSAFGKALIEALYLGLIDRLPRLAVIQAAGANPFFMSYASWLANNEWGRTRVQARTVATAIKIGDPVNFDKAARAIMRTNGVVAQVTDEEIMDAHAVLSSDGVGAEPASCAAVAGLRQLIGRGVIAADDRTLVILTGHLLKDPDATVAYHSEVRGRYANAPVIIDPDVIELKTVIARRFTP